MKRIPAVSRSRKFTYVPDNMPSICMRFGNPGTHFCALRVYFNTKIFHFIILKNEMGMECGMYEGKVHRKFWGGNLKGRATWKT